MATIIYGTNASETLDASDGITYEDEIVYGYGGNDTIFGLGGDDQLVGGLGADLLNGGSGTDYAGYVDSAAGVQISLVEGKGYGGEAEGDTLVSIESLGGSYHDDVLIGDDKANELKGLLGDDVLKGGGGADQLFGGQGEDLLTGGAGADLIDGGYDIDTVSYVGSNGAVLVNLGTSSGFGGHAQGDTILDVENVDGSGFGDFLHGSAVANIIRGLEGNDLINAYEGDDFVEGGAGGDTLVGGTGIDTLSYAGSTAGVAINLGNGQALGGHAQGDSFSGFENVIGSDHVDALFGDGLANLLKGGKGSDTIVAGLNDDVVEGGIGADTLDGGSGIDTLSYAGSSAGVVINLGNGQVQGGDATGDVITGFENLFGSAFADSLFGDGLANRIDGSGGADFLFGGANADVFVFRNTAAFPMHWTDTILDFVVGQDKIEYAAGQFDWADIQAAMHQVGADTLIDTGVTDVLIKNVNMASLTANDFLFV